MKKPFKIAIQMDPWSVINVSTDSTYLIALEAQKRGYELFSYQPNNLTLNLGVVKQLVILFSSILGEKIFII